MAVNLTVSALLAALRMTDTAEETAEATRLLAFGTLLVEQHAPFAPETAQNEAVIRVCGYLFDQPFAGRGNAYANSLRNSGAQSLLLPWVVHRAGSTEEAVASAMASGSASNPVIGIGVVGDVLTVTFADGSTQSLSLPAGMGVDQAARDAAAAAQSAALGAQGTADSKTTLNAATAEIAPFARENNPSGEIPPGRVAPNPEDGNLLIVGTGGRSFRYVNRPVPVAATQTVSGLVKGATSAQAIAAAGTAILGWTSTRIRQAISNFVRGWALDDTTPIPSVKLVNAPGGEGAGDDAYDWATEGHDAEIIPTDKINFAPVQLQIDEIVEQLHHTRGDRTAVVGQLGAGNASLRYTLPNNLDGEYDLTVKLKVRVQVGQFANISGNLHLRAAGGLGLSAAIPQETHNYGHAHTGELNFTRRGLLIAPGASQINFEAFVTGQSPPDTHFIEVKNLTLTDTSLVNAHNVDPFIAPWARAGNADQIPRPKLDLDALALGNFAQTDIDAIPTEGEQEFSYRATVLRDQDGTLAYVGGGWRLALAGGGRGRIALADWGRHRR